MKAVRKASLLDVTVAQIWVSTESADAATAAPLPEPNSTDKLNYQVVSRIAGRVLILVLGIPGWNLGLVVREDPVCLGGPRGWRSRSHAFVLASSDSAIPRDSGGSSR